MPLKMHFADHSDIVSKEQFVGIIVRRVREFIHEFTKCRDSRAGGSS